MANVVSEEEEGSEGNPHSDGAATTNAWQMTGGAYRILEDAMNAHLAAENAHTEAANGYEDVSPHRASHEAQAKEHGMMANKLKTMRDDCRM